MPILFPPTIGAQICSHLNTFFSWRNLFLYKSYLISTLPYGAPKALTDPASISPYSVVPILHAPPSGTEICAHLHDL